jgi:hypothetical protein
MNLLHSDAALGRRPSGGLARRSWRPGPAYQQGRWGYILAWALGVPIPILLLIYLLRGCT